MVHCEGILLQPVIQCKGRCLFKHAIDGEY